MTKDALQATRRALIVGSAAVSLAALHAGPVAAESTMNPRLASRLAVVRSFFELLHRKEIESWGNLWADEGRILIPYPPAGLSTSIDGKAEIVRAFRGLFANFDAFDVELTALYPAADSDAVCVEYQVRARIVGGVEYANSNIAVFRFDEAGQIRAYHDYFDPRRFQAVVNALPKP
ncbi:nuclear transport factor 2 family protein [Starkeya sp. ORNL1]|uniref:nuclear transport factor 2 family protein n=1 Tax=Starkeya sp. ORNL1 TaxID=2709380 RepID=UPI00146330C7|nr:nuclear transport factor 2 family protein [Starkeya sp. ORNL1]QJP15016.1 nuclear transport factor 2 family protein [Starkeya sp. ORNL1]